MLDILCATLGRAPLGLEYAPQPSRLLTDSRKGWGAASNALLDQAAAAGHDALFLDDDVELLPETFKDFDRSYPLADVFGWRLRAPSGKAISYGFVLHPNGALWPNVNATVASHVAHVTASVLYIKHAVLAAGVRFPIWPGIHHEDVAFTYDCWLRGFNVAYLPYDAIHHIHESGMGATKAHVEDLSRRKGENERLLAAWAETHGVMDAARAGRIPFGIRRI
jgi:GT2 family glycosyltransferase